MMGIRSKETGKVIWSKTMRYVNDGVFKYFIDGDKNKKPVLYDAEIWERIESNYMQSQIDDAFCIYICGASVSFVCRNRKATYWELEKFRNHSDNTKI